MDLNVARVNREFYFKTIQYSLTASSGVIILLILKD